MDGCVYRTKDGECDLYSEGGKFHAWCDFENCNEKHQSNADRIRSMTDKDMAMFLRSLTECVRCPAWDRDGEYDMRPCYTGKQSCSYMWLSWLKERAKDE